MSFFIKYDILYSHISHLVIQYMYTVTKHKSLDNFRAILRSATGTKLYSIERKFTNFIFRGTARNISTGFCFALTVSHRLYTTVQYCTVEAFFDTLLVIIMIHS